MSAPRSCRRIDGLADRLNHPIQHGAYPHNSYLRDLDLLSPRLGRLPSRGLASLVQASNQGKSRQLFPGTGTGFMRKACAATMTELQGRRMAHPRSRLHPKMEFRDAMLSV
jgi:hypothetical protein